MSEILRCAAVGRYSGVYPSLSDKTPMGGRDSAGRIAILTQDIFGPVKNAGIGTAYMHAAMFLAERKFDITIIYTQGRESQTRPIDYWISFYRERGIKLCCADQTPGLITASAALRWSYNGFRHLSKMKPFSIIHSSECGASPYYSLLAKRNLGLFRESKFCIKTSSPHLWSREGNETSIALDTGPIIAMAERYSVENADLVISPSQHMLDWMAKHSYTLPADICVQPNIMPLQKVLVSRPGVNCAVEELVFFGRLEPRKGISLFAEAAVSAVEKSGRKPKITFLGKRRDDLDFNFDSFLAEFQARVGVDVTTIFDFDAQQAVEYLKQDGRLAIIPSLLDNSPFTVYEALMNGVPFIASAVGGIPELIHPEDRDDLLFAPRSSALSAALVRVLANGAHPGRLSFDPTESLAIWEQFHRSRVPVVSRSELLEQKAKSSTELLVTEISFDEHTILPIVIDETLTVIDEKLCDYVVVCCKSGIFNDKHHLQRILGHMRRSGHEVCILPFVNGDAPEASCIVNIEPNIWTKLEYAILPTSFAIFSYSTFKKAVALIAEQVQIVSTNLDEIIAASTKVSSSVVYYPSELCSNKVPQQWRFSRVLRNRQVRVLTSGLPADLANVFRVNGALQDERSRIVAAQPVINSLRRLIRILGRVRSNENG